MPFYADMKDEKQRIKARRRRDIAQLIAYLLIVSIGVFGFHEQDKQNKARCESAAQIRDVIRGQVLAIYDLGLSATQRPPNARPLTPSEQQQLDAYVKNLQRFRDNQLKKIVPSSACEKYDK